MTTPRYRIGNDLTILWAICNRDGSPFNLDGKVVRLFVSNQREREEVEPIISSLEDGSTNNVIRWDFKGEDQKILGMYTLTVEIRTSEENKLIKKDYTEAFTLVGRSCSESEDEGEANINDGGDLYLSSKLDIYRFGIPKTTINTKGNWVIDGVDTQVSALGGGPGLVKEIYNENDFDKEFDADSVVDTFNASAIQKIRRQVSRVPEFSIASPMDDNVLIYKEGKWVNISARELFLRYATPSAGGVIDNGYWYVKDGILYTDMSVAVLGNLGVGGPGLGGNGEGAQVVTALSELTDVSIYNPKAGEILVYENGKWINKIFSVDIPVMPDLDGYATEAWVERQGYVKAADLTDPLSKIETFSDWFEWADEEHTTIRTKYNFFSQKQIAVGEKGEADSPASGGGITGIQVNGNIYNDADEFGIITIPNYPTELRWESVTGRPTKLTDFENDLDLSAYAGRQYVDDTFYTKAAAIVLSQGLTASQEAINKLNVLLEWFKYDSVNDAVYTDKSFYSKLQLAAGERGENASAGGGTITGIRVNGKDYASPDEYGILTIPDYPTSLNWDDITGKPTDLGQFTNEAGYIKDNALEGYATQGWVEAKQYALASNVYDKDAINQKEKDLSDRIALFEKWFREDSAGNLYTTYNFYSTKQLATGEAGAAHEGEGGGGRVNGIIINGTEYVEVDDYGNLVVSETLATLSDLASYLKNTDADNKFATKTYVNDTFATITSLGGVNERLKEIEEYFNGSGEDADNKINKWNEIVAFLNATEDTTLAGILAAYTLKSDHNSLVNRVSANETSISGINTTLGSHTSTLSEHTTAIAALGNKVNPIDTWFNEVGQYFKKDSDGVWYVDGDFYTKGQNAAGAVGSPDGGGSSGSGVMLLESWADVPSDLSGYALSAALGIDLHERFNNYYTIGDVDSRFSGINSRLATLDSGMADRYTKSESDGRYLPLTGGTITGASGNYTPLIIKTTSLSEVWIAFEDTVGVTHIGSARGVPSINSGNGNKTLLHSGNVGEYAVKSYGIKAANDIKGDGFGYTYASTEHGGAVSGGVMSAGLADAFFQLNGDDDNDVLYYRRYFNGFGKWKQIAFTDSNVASATKLSDNTAFSAWGQTFFANGKPKSIDGNIYINSLSAIESYGSGFIFGWGKRANPTRYCGSPITFYVNNVERMFINESGNVTIGSTDLAGTSAKLYVGGVVKIKPNDNYQIIFESGVGGVQGAGITFWENGWQKATIQASSLHLNPSSGGNVLIGTTTNSGYKLDVAGTGRFSNLLTASAGISTPHITIGGITISVVDGVLRIDGNVYTTGQLGVGAVGQEGGGTGGGGVLLLNTWPTDGGSYAGYALGGNLGIDLNTRVKTLEGKAAAVSFSQTLTSGKQIGVLTIDGSSSVLYAPSTYAWSEITSRPSKLSDFTDDVVSGKYLPLSGGMMQGGINWAIEQTSAWDNYFDVGGNRGLRILNAVGYSVDGAPSDYASALIVSGYYGYALAWDAYYEQLKYRGSGKSDWRTILHSGNYSDYALPLTGGTIKGITRVNTEAAYPFYIKNTSGNLCGMQLQNTDTTGLIMAGGDYGVALLNPQGSYNALGVTDAGVPYFGTSANKNTLIHSGNIGSQSVTYANSAGDADTLDGYSSGRFLLMTGRDYAEMDLNTLGGSQSIFTEIRTSEVTTTNSPYSGYGALLSLKDRSGIAKMQFLGSYNSSVLYFRSQHKPGADITSDWKQIAFTDSNVASATKLSDNTAFTAWGQTFFENGKPKSIDGNIYINSLSAIESYGSGFIFGWGKRANPTRYCGSPITFYVNNVERMFINESGNVTIGLTDLAGTSAKLYVNGNKVAVAQDANAEMQIYVKNSIARAGILLASTGHRGFYDFTKDSWVIATDGTKTWLNAGNVGIGTAEPYCPFEVASSYKDINPTNIAASAIFAVNRHKDDGLFIGHDYTKKGSWIQSAYYGTEANPSNKHTYSLFLNPLGGNVLVGTTTNSGYKLDVAGSIRTTSSLTIGTIVLTDENGTLKIAGNAYTTGQLGAGEAGEATSGGGSVILDYDSIVDALGFTPAKQNDLSSLTSRVLALENAGPSSSSSSLYGDEITIGSSMGNIYISSENDVQIDSIMGSVLVNGSEVLTNGNTAFTRNYSSGTKIGTIKIGGVSTDIYVPASSSSSLWTTEYSIDVGNDVLAASKEYIGTNTIVGWDAAGSCVNDLYIGYDGYTIWMQGSVDEASDMRLKTVIDAVNLDIRDIAFAPIFNYVFKSRPQGRQMLGSSAQYWQPITPSAVSENDKGNLGMNYGAVALASVVAVAKETLTQREEIAELKSMALTQKEEIANLKLKVQSLETRLAKYELN